MSLLWLRLAVRQLLRTLGQQRAALPLLVVFVITFPTAIVSVDQMAPFAHSAFWRLSGARADKLVYLFCVMVSVLLFPLQIQVLKELESSQELENLERFPLARRSLYHFKLIDQGVLYAPLLALALTVTLLGGLFTLSESKAEYHARKAKGGGVGSETGVGDGVDPALDAALERKRRVAMFLIRQHAERELSAMRAAGASERDAERRRFGLLRRGEVLLPVAIEGVRVAALTKASDRPARTRLEFATMLWERAIRQPIAVNGPPDSIPDLGPTGERVWREGGFERGLRFESGLLLVGALGMSAVGVQLLLLAVVVGVLGLIPRALFRQRLLVIGILGMLMLAGMVLIAVAFPSTRHPGRRLLLLPWVLIPLLIERVEARDLASAWPVLGALLMQLVLLYELAGFAFHSNLLRGRAALLERLTRLMQKEPAQISEVRSRRIGPPGPLAGLVGERVALLVAKDMRQLTRPPVNRLILMMLGLPLMALVSVVVLGLLLGAPSPFGRGRMSPYGAATLMTLAYGGLTLLWIPCAQIFLFAYERWGVTLMWFGPIESAEIYRAKATSATLAIAPAVALSYLGMALFLMVGGGAFSPALILAGAGFVGVTALLFGSLVASLGFLFPFFMQTRFKHLAGGLGFLIQLTLLPAWIGTCMYGATCVALFGGKGLLICAGCGALWVGFAWILAREATYAIDKLGREYGKNAAEAAAAVRADEQRAVDEARAEAEAA